MGLFAQVASGVGSGMVSNVDNSRKIDAAQVQNDHQMTLQRMRDQAAGTRQEDLQQHDFDKYDKSREDAVADLGEQREYDEGIAASDLENERTDAATKHGYDLELEDRQNANAIARAEAADPKVWDHITAEVIVGTDQFGGAVYGKKQISYNKQEGRYYEWKNGARLPYDLVSNLTDNEKVLEAEPNRAIQWAEANGGAESLPAWFKLAHKDVYEDVKKDLKEEEGGGGKENVDDNEIPSVAPKTGVLSEGATERDRQLAQAASQTGGGGPNSGWGEIGSMIAKPFQRPDMERDR